jgi:hypothetical protein
MPEDQLSALQLHLFASDSPAYQAALARYEEIRPILKHGFEYEWNRKLGSVLSRSAIHRAQQSCSLACVDGMPHREVIRPSQCVTRRRD